MLNFTLLIYEEHIVRIFNKLAKEIEEIVFFLISIFLVQKYEYILTKDNLKPEYLYIFNLKMNS